MSKVQRTDESVKPLCAGDLPDRLTVAMTHAAIRSGVAPVSFIDLMAEGECLCAGIDPGDRPCLTCEAQEALRAIPDPEEPWGLTHGEPADAELAPKDREEMAQEEAYAEAAELAENEDR